MCVENLMEKIVHDRENRITIIISNDDRMIQIADEAIDSNNLRKILR